MKSMRIRARKITSREVSFGPGASPHLMGTNTVRTGTVLGLPVAFSPQRKEGDEWVFFTTMLFKLWETRGRETLSDPP